jgi:hypothetical protein
VLNKIIKVIDSYKELKSDKELKDDADESLMEVVDKQRGRKLLCSIIKHEQIFSLSGEVILPDGNIDVEINDYIIPGYFLFCEEYDMRKKCYTGRTVCYLCGTIRQSANRAYVLIKRKKPHVLHIADLLEEAGYPKVSEFDEYAKSPIKREARRQEGVDGNSVSNRNVMLKGYDVKTA